MDPKKNNEGESGTKDLPGSAEGATHSQNVLSEKFKEQFEELKFPELAFADNWTLWEQYETKNSANYQDTMEKVACFNDPISFWKVWNTVPHSDPLNFIHYYDEEGAKRMVAKHYVVKGSEQKISAVSLFKTGIEPAWEDPVNHTGGEFSMKIKCNKEDIRPIWEGIILEIISSNFPNSDQVCGIRMLDKAQMFKVEIWVKYPSTDGPEYNSQLDKLNEVVQGYDADISFYPHKK